MLEVTGIYHIQSCDNYTNSNNVIMIYYVCLCDKVIDKYLDFFAVYY